MDTDLNVFTSISLLLLFQTSLQMNSLHRGQVSKDDVHGVNRISAEGFLQVQRFGHTTPRQDFVQHVPADQRHKSDGDFKRAVLPTFAWQCDIQVDLKGKLLLDILACVIMIQS